MFDAPILFMDRSLMYPVNTIESSSMTLANVFANLLNVDATMFMSNMLPSAAFVALSPTSVTVFV